MAELIVKYDGRSFARLQGLLKTFPQVVTTEFRRAVIYTKGVIVKDFMTVVDGEVGTTKNGKPSYPPRRKFPGVRVRTGALRRGVNTTGKVEVRKGELEARIYPPNNVSYGNDLEKDVRYQFLKPGFEKARTKLRKMIGDIVAKHFR